jgi:hypothetical protein
MPSRTLRELREDAEKVLAEYTDPSSHYAFHTYDRLGDPAAPLEPQDVLLANLLSLRLGWREVIPLFADGDGDPQALRSALDEALIRLRRAESFEDHPSLDALEETVVPLANANTAAIPVTKWTHVTVSKVLHRRLPHIVPIIDSRVRAFYGARRPSSVRKALWEDLRENRDWLAAEAARIRTPDNRRLSLLRASDILIWSAT